MPAIESVRRAGARLSPLVSSLGRKLSGEDVNRAGDTGSLGGLLAASGAASMADVSRAYRLILGREPDQQGREMYAARVESGTLARDQLVAELIGSAEFARRNASNLSGVGKAQEVVLDEFVVTVDPADWAVGQAIASDKCYEPEVTSAVRSRLVAGGTFIDVGANVGWFSLLAAKLVGPSGRVLAVEPNPRNCELLESSKRRNGFDHLEVVAGAASDQDCWLALETDASNGRVIPLGTLSADSKPVRCSYVVPAFRLDQLVAERAIERVDAIKVDVEGVEAKVFAGAERLLGRLHPPVIFEWYPAALRSTGGVDPSLPLQMLRDLGYGISIVEGRLVGSGDAERSLSDSEIEAAREAGGRELLDLLATYRNPARAD